MNKSGRRCIFCAVSKSWQIRPPHIAMKIKRISNSSISSFLNIFKVEKCLRRYKKLSWKYVNTAEIITNAYDDPFFKKTLIWRFRFCWLSYQNFLANLFSQCKVSLCERNTHDASSVCENCCSISAQKTTKKNLQFSRFVEKWKHRLGLES